MAKYHRIKDLREDSDKTQQELADYLGTSSQHYGKYELGHAEIPFERAIALAKYYGVSLDYIAELTNEKKNPSPAVSAEEKALSRLFDDFSPEEREKLAELLKALLAALEPRLP
ncbi:MAG: helix-turn-helix domain-containing protein [Bacteroides sp.]|nr:helix-turn-helix domain-containing protein [Eubacterium sp.]MCM1418413.1 helix-turn-helix domain-containing protein [Roseburia sp.]MCM1461565.1 helix-turn-helix domain-containing protein [Bacteroides sp.]